jgi:preprotein translocase subunit SecE
MGSLPRAGPDGANEVVLMSSEVAERDEQERRRIGPITFAKEVRAEGRKVTWTSRQETMVYTIFVLILIVMAAAFFFVTDTLISAAIKWLLSLTT